MVDMEDRRPLITLLTDFGDADAFVGIMKGVILGIAPQAQLVDLSHLISPQDIKQAAYILMTATPFFAKETVHLVVVDPGVGSARRPIAVSTSDAYFVAPDNGVLSYVLAKEETYRVVELSNPRYRLPDPSSTFHGRDIFSPAAAHLASGIRLDEMGPELEELVLLDPPRLIIGDDHIEAEVLNVDHFGNLRTSILLLNWVDERTLELNPLFTKQPAGEEGKRFSATEVEIEVGGHKINGISTTFSDAPLGQPLAYVGSEGGLEIAINQGNAGRELGVESGDEVALTF
jgi:S-adenosylmethionine hydrolase